MRVKPRVAVLDEEGDDDLRVLAFLVEPQILTVAEQWRGLLRQTKDQFYGSILLSGLRLMQLKFNANPDLPELG